MRYSPGMRFYQMQLAACLVLAGCGSDANVAGNYSLAITSGASTCPIQGWRPGNMTVGTALTVMQSGANITAQVAGGGGLMLGALVGSNTLTGTVSGDEMSLTLHGTRTFTQMTCSFTYDVNVQARLSGQ